jgi:L-fuculokinase
MEKLAIVFDCGATNIRTVAVDTHGRIVAIESVPNQTHPDPTYPGGLIWDLDEIWSKLCLTARKVTSTINRQQIVAVATTTFGVDGALLDPSGRLLAPVISWQCQRTTPILQNISRYIPLQELYAITGVNAYAFNTINKLIWYHENQPELLHAADRFLFMPSLINFLLTGNKLNDSTMLGTSMLAELSARSLSAGVLQKIGCPLTLFGSIGEPGDAAGTITSAAARLTGIPEGTPVCLAGHDTQFAIFGSGAGQNQPVLSSGTWEIMMTRSKDATASSAQLSSGVTTEFDAQAALYNIGMNWLGSGVVEWFRRMFFGAIPSPECYEVMMNEASLVPPGSQGVIVDPDFGNLSKSGDMGRMLGMTMQTTRAHLMRACFEALCYTAKQALETLEQAGNFKAGKLIVVGGGSKNKLWNQIRADVVGIPVETIQHKETTILGASFFAFASAGVYSSAQQARESIDYAPETFFPSSDTAIYQELYIQWKSILKRD